MHEERMALQRLGIRQLSFVGTFAAALILTASPARAEPKATDAEAQACATAYTKAQQSEQAGHLREAKDTLLACTRSVCGKLLEKECLARYNRLSSDIPTIVLHVDTGEEGAPPPGALQIRMDGALLTSRLDEPMEVDPGVHKFAVGTPDGMAEVSRQVMVLQGDASRSVVLSLPLGGASPPVAAGGDSTGASGKPTPAEIEQPYPPAIPVAVPLILGGVGVAGVATGAAFLIAGSQNTWNLAVDSLAVGAGALLGALWIVATPHSAKKSPQQAAYVLDVRPSASGGIASLSGTF
jgi:hypothetical protein